MRPKVLRQAGATKAATCDPIMLDAIKVVGRLLAAAEVA